MPAANAQLGDALLCAPDLPPLDGVSRACARGLQLGALKARSLRRTTRWPCAFPPPAACRLLALDRAGALRYQSGEALPAPEDMSGWTLAVYEGLVLGFGKASGGQFKITIQRACAGRETKGAPHGKPSA